MNLMPIPTLEELAESPAKAKGLPPDARQALTFRALAVLNALFTAGLADVASNNGNGESRKGDRLLSAKEVAGRMGMSLDYVYKNASEFPFAAKEGRRLLFSERGLAEYLQGKMKKKELDI